MNSNQPGLKAAGDQNQNQNQTQGTLEFWQFVRRGASVRSRYDGLALGGSLSLSRSLCLSGFRSQSTGRVESDRIESIACSEGPPGQRMKAAFLDIEFRGDQNQDCEVEVDRVSFCGFLFVWCFLECRRGQKDGKGGAGLREVL